MSTKYNIEGNIDFFNELYKSLDDLNEQNDDSNLCLITNQPLVDKFVTLKCGHKFNYVALYNDLINHNTKFNSLEASNGRLSGNEIRCPYCRSKENSVLPYYEELGLKKVSGVNSEYKDVSVIYHQKRCEYLIPNGNFDPSSNNIIEIGTAKDYYNCKFYKCFHTYTSQLDDTYEDKKCYCWYHKKIVLKQYKKQASDKLKQEKQQLKEQVKKAKEEAKQKLLDEKQKVKDEKQKVNDEKQKAKEELKKMVIEEKIKSSKPNAKSSKSKQTNNTNNNAEENVIIGTIDISCNSLLCSQLLKTGPNKGKQCETEVFKDNLCKRHYNLKK
jgi:hypothetical protein